MTAPFATPPPPPRRTRAQRLNANNEAWKLVIFGSAFLLLALVLALSGRTLWAFYGSILLGALLLFFGIRSVRRNPRP